MKSTNQYSIPSLPTKQELMLYLIAEDLKSRKFFDGLRELGLNDAWYQADLGELILTYARLTTNSDKVLDFYYHLLELHSQDLQPNRTSLVAAAKAAYHQLMVFAESIQLPGNDE